MDQLPWLTIAGRLSLAIACGSILGWERSTQHKPAGLRTHMLVALGSAAAMLASLNICPLDPRTGYPLAADLTRTIQGIVGGIGFLGAGTIIRSRGSVKGITTAATIWVMGAVGIACAVGSYIVALVTTALAFVILRALAWIESRWLLKSVPGDSAVSG